MDNRKERKSSLEDSELMGNPLDCCLEYQKSDFYTGWVKNHFTEKKIKYLRHSLTK